MLSIKNAVVLARALDSPLDPDLKRLLALRRDQLMEYADHEFGELACFIVVEPGDTVPWIEAEARFPIVTTPAFEWVAKHRGWYEAPTILSDDGYGIVLFVPDRDDIDPQLLLAVRPERRGTPAT